MSKLQDLEEQKRRLQLRIVEERKKLKPLYLELNDTPLLMARAANGRTPPVPIQNRVEKSKQKVKFMKSKLTYPNEMLPKVTVACKYAEVNVLNIVKVNPKKSSLVVSHSTPNSLVEIGEFIATLTDKQVETELAAMSAEKEKAEKTAAKK